MYPIGFEECEEAAEDLGVDIERGTPKPGELYIAGRNTVPKLLTCIKVTDGFVVPEEDAYCYDTHECFRLVDEHQPS